MVFIAILVGLAVGALVGFLGIGGGIVLVPALTSLLGLSQHVAQGTSLFMQLPPLGLGALLVYWRRGQVDLRAGAVCAAGFFLGGYFGSRMAVGMGSRELQVSFGVFLMISVLLLWRKSETPGHPEPLVRDPRARLALAFVVACGVGVLGGLFGVGGGVILVPLLVFLLGFEQHVAQGTSLVALVPPTGLLAFLNYARAGEVHWKVGLLIMPGIFLGGIAGGRIAQRFPPRKMQRIFAVLLLLLGIWQAVAALLRR